MFRTFWLAVVVLSACSTSEVPGSSCEYPETRCDEGIFQRCIGGLWTKVQDCQAEGSPCFATVGCGTPVGAQPDAGSSDDSGAGGADVGDSNGGQDSEVAQADVCVPDCAGAVCEDGCGGLCPTGPTGESCQADGVCAKGVLVACNDSGTLFCDYRGVPAYETGSELACDGLDNDCDGATDEGLEAPSATVCGVSGVCQQATSECIKGVWDCTFYDVSGFENKESSCDGLDNDCDGATDEDLVSANLCPGAGVCTGQTVAFCVEGAWACDYSTVGAFQAVETSCDGLDNDCDGLTDEPATLSLVCPAAQGQCALTGPAVATCVNGQVQCTYSSATIEASETVCDGLDNDCDGETDENLVGNVAACSGQAFGVCQAVTIECKGGGWQCRYDLVNDYDCAALTPELCSESTCDGKDNDCDGDTDEGLGSGADTCEGLTVEACTVKGVGVCDVEYFDWECCVGTLKCKMKATAADQLGSTYQPGGEFSCDGLDNDCDGAADVGLTGGSCLEYETLAPDGIGGDPVLVEAQGVCTTASTYCDSGAWVCDFSTVTLYEPGAELSCDGQDNDCDGLVDEVDSLDLSEACSEQSPTSKHDQGVCDGQVDPICGNASWSCAYESVPCYVASEEQCQPGDSEAEAGCGLWQLSSFSNPCEWRCDGVDNDCDGETDEGGRPLYADADGDGWGGNVASKTLGWCPGKAAPAGFSPLSGDCNDGDPLSYPGAPESCNAQDDDCDGVADETVQCDCADVSPPGLGCNLCTPLLCFDGQCLVDPDAVGAPAFDSPLCGQDCELVANASDPAAWQFAFTSLAAVQPNVMVGGTRSGAVVLLDPSTREMLGWTAVTGGAVNDVLPHTGNRVFAATDTGGIRIVDLTEGPENPKHESKPVQFSPGGVFTESEVLTDKVWALAAQGKWIYAAAGPRGLLIIDPKPPLPQKVGFVTLAGEARDVVVRGIYAYVAVVGPADGPSGLQIVNISDPEDPDIILNFDTSSPGDEPPVAVGPKHILFETVGHPLGLGIDSSNDPASPTLADLFMLVDNGGVHRLAVAEPAKPAEIAHYALSVVDFEVEGNLLRTLAPASESADAEVHWWTIGPEGLDPLADLTLASDEPLALLSAGLAMHVATENGVETGIAVPGAPTSPEALPPWPVPSVDGELEEPWRPVLLRVAGALGLVGLEKGLLIHDLTQPGLPVVGAVDTTPTALAADARYLWVGRTDRLEIYDWLDGTPELDATADAFAGAVAIEVIGGAASDPTVAFAAVARGNGGASVIRRTVLGDAPLLQATGAGPVVEIASDLAYATAPGPGEGLRRLLILAGFTLREVDVADPNQPAAFATVCSPNLQPNGVAVSPGFVWLSSSGASGDGKVMRTPWNPTPDESGLSCSGANWDVYSVPLPHRALQVAVGEDGASLTLVAGPAGFTVLAADPLAAVPTFTLGTDLRGLGVVGSQAFTIDYHAGLQAQLLVCDE